MAIEKLEKKKWNLTPFLSGQPLMENWVAHGQPYPFWISESLACLECSCHIWVLQLIYFDKIYTSCILSKIFLLFPFSHFFQMCKATHFVVLGHI
jgi:hypothetical protein